MESAAYDAIDLQNMAVNAAEAVNLSSYRIAAGASGADDSYALSAGIAAANAAAGRQNDAAVLDELDEEAAALRERQVESTDLMAQTNAAYNANRFLSASAAGQMGSVRAAGGRAKRDVYRVQQQALGHAWSRDRTRFQCGLIMMTVVATMAVLMPVAAAVAGYFGTRLAVLCCAVILALYAVALFAALRRAAYRRSASWDQVYWRAGGEQRRATLQATNQTPL